MRFPGALGAAVAFAVGLAFIVVSVPISSADRSEGTYWTYDVAMNMYSLDLTGEVTYTVEGVDTVVTAGDLHDATVLRILGELGGSMNLDGMEQTYAVVLDGHSYELSGSLATAREDMNMFVNLTTVVSGLEFSNHSQYKSAIVNDPALMMGFDDESDTGDSWDEMVAVTETTTVWIEGAVFDNATEDIEMQYSFEIAPSLDDVEVDGTIYPCVKITMTDLDGNYETRWYSEDVGYYAQVKEYLSNTSTPFVTMKLTDFSNKSSANSMLLFAGTGVAVAVVALVAILLLMRRRKPAPMPPSQPVQPGYYAVQPTPPSQDK